MLYQVEVDLSYQAFYIPCCTDKNRSLCSHRSEQEAEIQTSMHITSVFPTPKSFLLESSHLEFFASVNTLGPRLRLEIAGPYLPMVNINCSFVVCMA